MCWKGCCLGLYVFPGFLCMVVCVSWVFCVCFAFMRVFVRVFFFGSVFVRVSGFCVYMCLLGSVFVGSKVSGVFVCMCL